MDLNYAQALTMHVSNHTPMIYIWLIKCWYSS